MRFSFRDCTFDTETRELTRGGRIAPLGLKEFLLLETLIAERPKALSKAILIERIWPDVVVSEGSLTSLVASLRRACGEKSARAGVIRTVHGFGYAFAAEVTVIPDRAPRRSRFQLSWGGRRTRLTEGESFIGRDADAAIRIDDATVSRRHARIRVHGSEVEIEDLGSKNGTFVAEQRAAGALRVSNGDVIRIGSIRLLFSAVLDEGSTRTFREGSRKH